MINVTTILGCIASLTIVTLSACTTTQSAKCSVSAERREQFKKNVTAAIGELSTPTVTYSIEVALKSLRPVKGDLEGADVAAFKNDCYTYLFPSSVGLDGDGALIIDPTTLKVKAHVWFNY